MFAAQICAVVIFLIMFILLITERIPRQIVTLSCGLATLVLVFGVCLRDGSAVIQALSFQSFLSPGFWYRVGEAEPSTGINWETIVFIAGMMVMV